MKSKLLLGILFAFCITIPVTSFAETDDSAASSSFPSQPVDFIKTTGDLRISNYCQLYTFFEKGEFPNGDEMYLLSYDDVSEKYPNYKIDETHYEEFLDATKRFGYPYFERWHQDRYDGPTKNIDWMYMKEWQIHPEMFNKFENYMHKSDSRISTCNIPDESYMISHASFDGVCAPGFTNDGNICSLDYSCGYPSIGKMCTTNSDNDISQTQYLRPIKQGHAGIAKDDTICIEGKKLLLKTSDGSPACLNPESISKLVYRGWTKVGEYQNVLIQEHSSLEIKIGDPIDDRGLVPILTVQTFDNTVLHQDKVTRWGFQPENYGDWGPHDTRVSWDQISQNHAFRTSRVIDENEQNPIDPSRMPKDGFAVPSMLYGANLSCGHFEAYSAVVKYGFPSTYPLKEGTSKVFLPGNGGGLLPDNEKAYRFSMASFFEQTVELPDNAVVLSSKSEECMLENPKSRDFNHSTGFFKGYHDEIIFKLS